MADIVLLKRDDCFTTGYIIAEKLERSYTSVRKLIEKHENELKEFGRLSFEMTTLNTKGGVQNHKVYHLNEQQATYLITLMRNTDKVRAFKIELVKEFYDMRRFIAERHSNEWQDVRREGKHTRRLETDAIKKLVEYAKEQGSKNPDRLYVAYSRMINKALGIQRRELATAEQLRNVTMLEYIAINIIKNGMANGVHYKAIYQECKNRLDTLVLIGYIAS